jgi:hypothetical protein
VGLDGVVEGAGVDGLGDPPCPKIKTGQSDASDNIPMKTRVLNFRFMVALDGMDARLQIGYSMNGRMHLKIRCRKALLMFTELGWIVLSSSPQEVSNFLVSN